MDDFPGLLARDFGFRSQGKSSSISTSKGGIGSGSSSSLSSNKGRSGWNPTPSGSDSLLGDLGLFGNKNSQDFGSLGGFSDVYGGPPKYTNPSSSSSSLGLDPKFEGSKDLDKSSSMPIYDKPVYDEDIFDGVPGIKSSASAKYEDIFGSLSSPPDNSSSSYDDILGNLGRIQKVENSSGKVSREGEADVSGFDDLIPGFRGSRPPQKRETSEINRPHQSTGPSNRPTSSMPDDPFVILESTSIPAYSSTGLFTDPLEQISKPIKSGSAKVDGSSVTEGLFDAFDGLTKSVPSFSSEMNNNTKDKSPLKTGQNKSSSHTTAGKETTKKPAAKNSENSINKKVHFGNYRESHQTLFDMPTGPSDYHKSVDTSGFRPPDVNINSADMSPKSEENLEISDVWLTVSEIPLFTQPTTSPPPSRPPPPLVTKPTPVLKADKSSNGLNSRRKVTETSSFPQSTQNYQFPRPVNDTVKSSVVSSIDELEDFAMGRSQTYANERTDIPSEEEIETNSAAAASAAAMKEAMDRAEAKFKHAREVREREKDAKAARSREPARQEVDEKAMKDAQEREQKRLDEEQEQREREEKEKEQRRVEKERERHREIEREREKARQAVERATKEARDRAAAEARVRAERAAVGKANAEARARAERAAVQRASAEARERAAADAKERAERAAAEAKERAAAEVRDKARERAAVERAAAEVRARAERAAVDRVTAEARERAAAVAREKQQKNGNDLDSFFGMGAARPNSAPKQRATASDPAFDPQFQNKGSFEAGQRTSSGASSSIRKASSTTNIVDDLTSIFGAAPSSGEFQEVEGETEERRRARLERHQRTLERAAKALAEKNERDFQTQRDQAERHRIAETLDAEIKRWATGKEGNLRALLSTLQYVLWPECGWQPVSLTDLITTASVKKVYRKATLCIHPDKVQQKGANLQQKYIAEKVFDLLKEAWNKLNSEELF
ncbi:auxilin-related protein 1-like [Tasmannia lanceolata]|uniref:auxilin-related protein 1-like n=1 Tax=Tasmannia lanceolata TaxID=3420 RepID=UPI0040632624